ncbi:MAG TPA: hypothetical protein VN932_00430 [Rhizomicrobium sp.]|nr:hypothetical protein [Rhizomicrobium sp.]
MELGYDFAGQYTVANRHFALISGQVIAEAGAGFHRASKMKAEP